MAANISLQEGSQVDPWNSRERMYLAAIVLFENNKDWSNISECIKSHADLKCVPTDWYSPEKCAAQYQWMIKHTEIPKIVPDKPEMQAEVIYSYWKSVRLNDLKNSYETALKFINIYEQYKIFINEKTLDIYLEPFTENLRRTTTFFESVEHLFKQNPEELTKTTEEVPKGKSLTSPKTKELVQTVENKSASMSKEVAVHVETSSATGEGNPLITEKSVSSPCKSSIISEQSSPEKNTHSVTTSAQKTPPKTFFNPSNILSSTGLFQFSPTTSQVTSPTAVSSVTLSAPTLSKLLEMPPSFAGKLPPLPISPRAKAVEIKSPQKAILKLVEISSTSDTSKIKPPAINKVEVKEVDKKEQMPSKTELIKAINQKQEIVPAETSVLCPEQAIKLSQKSDNKLSTQGKQEVIVTYFKPEEKFVDPTFKKTSEFEKTEDGSLKSSEQISLSDNVPYTITPEKVQISEPINKPLISSETDHKTNLKILDPFTFDENSDKLSQKTFTHGIKRKRDSASITQEISSVPEKLKHIEVSTDEIIVQVETEKTNSQPSPMEVSDLIPVQQEYEQIVLKTNAESEKECQIESISEIVVEQTIENTSENTTFNTLVIETDKNTNATQKEKNFTSPLHGKKSDVDNKGLKPEKITSPLKDVTVIQIDSPDIIEETVVIDQVIETKLEESSPKSTMVRPSSRRGRRGRSRAPEKIVSDKKELAATKNQDIPDLVEPLKEKPCKVKTGDKKLEKVMDIAEDESTTSSQDSEKEFSLGSRNNTEDASEKKTSECSDDGENSLKNATSTHTNVIDNASTSCPSTHVVRGKGRWSPQSIGPTSQSSVITPTTSDSSDESEIEESDDSANPKKTKLKFQDKESENKYKAWKKFISILWREAANHRYANVFAQKVTDDVAPGYHSIVARPMDLATIKKNIDNGTITTTEEFQRDVMLMFQNAIMYNSSDHDVYHMAVEMQRDVIMQIQDLATQLSMQDEQNEKYVIPRNVRQSKTPHKGIQRSTDSKDGGK